MKSQTINIYTRHNALDGLTQEQIAFADSVYYAAEQSYDDGGDTIVECMTPAEVIREFSTIEDAMDFCDVRYERQREIESTAF